MNIDRSSAPSNRRDFLKGLGGIAASAALISTSTSCSNAETSIPLSAEKMNTHFPLSTNVYPWGTFYKRQGRDFDSDLANSLAEVKESGADHFEPNLKSLEFVDTLSDELEKQGIGMVSVYVNSELHDSEKAKESIDWVMAIVRQAKKRMGAKIVVTNPSPIRWGGPENKTDEQLEIQRDALENLGKAISGEGMSLAYHSHDPEFREGAREFHHMLASTDPRYVKLCLDAHWVFRGAGDSNVALHDIVKLYGSRIAELHIRQSNNGIWTETFGDGDIDYSRLTRELVALGVSPLVTMEQAVEAKSLNTMNGLSAHKISHANARETFAPFIV
jgi:inosose dehydratase